MRRGRRPPTTRERSSFQLSKIGTNLNQLAKVANERRALPREAELREVAGQIKATLIKVLRL
jgi:hypothetical protein